MCLELLLKEHKEAGPSRGEVISLQKVNSLLVLVDAREAKKVSANSQPLGFEACILNGMG
jgi:hypothetical protein